MCLTMIPLLQHRSCTARSSQPMQMIRIDPLLVSDVSYCWRRQSVRPQRIGAVRSSRLTVGARDGHVSWMRRDSDSRTPDKFCIRRDCETRIRRDDHTRIQRGGYTRIRRDSNSRIRRDQKTRIGRYRSCLLYTSPSPRDS